MQVLSEMLSQRGSAHCTTRGQGHLEMLESIEGLVHVVREDARLQAELRVVHPARQVSSALNDWPYLLALHTSGVTRTT